MQGREAAGLSGPRRTTDLTHRPTGLGTPGPLKRGSRDCGLVFVKLPHVKLEQKMFEYIFIHLEIIKINILYLNIQNNFYEK